MPFPFLDDVALRAIDGELRHLLARLSQSPPEQQSTLAGCARGIIERAVEGRLVRRGWEGSWARGEGVATGWFGDVDHHEMAAALYAVFTELVRYVQTDSTSHRRSKYAAQLADALKDYLPFRGYTIEDPASLFLDFRGQQQRLLLSLWNKGSVPINEVICAVWGNRPPRQPVDTLHKLKTRTNRVLAEKNHLLEVKREGQTYKLSSL